MDPVSILALVVKGLSVANTLIQAGQSAAPTVKLLFETINKPASEITQADLDSCESQLDANLAEFNAPLPPE